MNNWTTKPAYSPQVDPYLDWIMDGGATYLVDSAQAATYGEVIDERVVCLVGELKDDFTADEWKDLETAIGVVANSNTFGAMLLGKLFVSIRADRTKLASFLAKLPDILLRVDASMPVALQRKARIDGDTMGNTIPFSPTADLLLGVIDDACPFAHFKLSVFPQNRLPKTRIRAMWSQGLSGDPKLLNGIAVGQRHPRYGRVFFADDLHKKPSGIETNQTQPPRPIAYGLNSWINANTDSATGAVDEDGCYSRLGMRILRHRESHGAHVLDMFAGRVAPAARQAARAIDSPTWLPDASPAAAAPIVFVQLPRFCVEDTSGRWLASSVLDGLSFILDQAAVLKSKHVVTNLSYGHTTGPHDRSSIAECALSHLCNYYDGSKHVDSGESKLRPKLSLILPVGNSFKAQAVGALTIASNEKEEFVWRVLPDGQRPAFLELYFPVGTDPKTLKLSIKVAGDERFQEVAVGYNKWLGSNNQAAWCIYKATSGLKLCANYRMTALIVLAPTDCAIADLPGRSTAPAGDWRVCIENCSAIELDVQAYVARSTPHLLSRRTGTLSYLVDSRYGPNRYLREQLDDDPLSGSTVTRRQTISGIATATGVTTVTGYRLIDNQHSRYASAGQTNDGRSGVSIGLPSDVSDALLGMRAGGNRSGATFRLVGTSVASPQAARSIANGIDPAAYPKEKDEALVGAHQLPQP